MSTFYLARHGQDQDNAEKILNGHRDRPLTLLGRHQATELAAKIKAAGIKFDFVYTSPLHRAMETAQIITQQMDLPEPIKLAGLIERDFGIMTGRPQAEIMTRCAPDIVRAEKITYFLSPAGAETFPDLIKRAKQVLNFLTARHPEDAVLIVTHGDFGKMLYAAFYNKPWQDVLTKFHFGNSDLLLLAPNTKISERQVIQSEQYNL